MKKIKRLILVIAALASLGVSASDSPAATWYIRPDGGDSTQCTGLTDAAYPGSGAAQPCAFNHPFWVLPPKRPTESSRTVLVQGGDTVIIDQGEYMMGYGAPNTPGTSACTMAASYDCVMPPIPSGPDVSHPTKIYGKNWETKSTPPPQLWGTHRAKWILDLTGSSNVEVRYLELTDHSACIDNSPDPARRCNRTAPYSPDPYHADYGIRALDSANVLLKDLDIHGLSVGGVWAGRLTDWTTEDTVIRANAKVGWNGDIGEGAMGIGTLPVADPPTHSSNAGAFVFRRSKIEYSGCGETYPGKAPYGCFGQGMGGYGDGFGSFYTAGTWLIENSEFSHNTQDGLDLLYHVGDEPVLVKRSRFEGNAGNGLKVSGNVNIENSVLIANCNFFVGNSITETTLGSSFPHCRASGTALVTAGWQPGRSITMTNSLVTGTALELIDVGNSHGLVRVGNSVTGNASLLYRDGLWANNAALDKVWVRYLEGSDPNGKVVYAKVSGKNVELQGTWVPVGSGVFEMSGYLAQTGNASDFSMMTISTACTGTERFVSRNNIFLGMQTWRASTMSFSTAPSEIFYRTGENGDGFGTCGSGSTAIIFDNKDSIVYNGKHSACPNSDNVLCVDPLLSSIPPYQGLPVGANYPPIYQYGDRWDVTLKPESPAVDKLSLQPGETVYGSVAVPGEDMANGMRPYNGLIDWGPYEYRPDTQPPVITVKPFVSPTNVATLTISGTVTDNVGVEAVSVKVGSNAYVTADLAGSAWSFASTALAVGNNEITIEAVDKNGNTSNQTVTIEVLDVSAPVAVIISPADSATVGGMVTVSAGATDNAGVSKVEFYVNGTLQATAATAPYTFNWDTATVANGVYELTARVYDAAGNVGQSAKVSVTVRNFSVSIVNPANGSTSSGRTAVTVSATGGKGVSRVRLYINGKLYATKIVRRIVQLDEPVPLSFNWRTRRFKNGTYTLTAKAFDRAGKIVESSPVTATVSNPVAVPAL